MLDAAKHLVKLSGMVRPVRNFALHKNNEALIDRKVFKDRAAAVSKWNKEILGALDIVVTEKQDFSSILPFKPKSSAGNLI